ncbi:MAG: AIR synthase-related protein, partial [Chloroflexota bacterium]|nr:AIR synthase-related protein [Chloroflexota bacterium]
AVDRPARILLADAQTSGGLLIAIPPEDEAALRQALERAGSPAAATVGRITAPDSCLMYVRPMDTTDDIND